MTQIQKQVTTTTTEVVMAEVPDMANWADDARKMIEGILVGLDWNKK